MPAAPSHPCVDSVLIVGGGVAGLCATVALRRKGIAVDLVELKASWSVYGVGIIQQCNVVRAVAALGLADAFLGSAFAFDASRIYTQDGSLIAEVPQPRAAGPDYPACVGMSRRKLHDVLYAAARESGARIRTGLTIGSMDDAGTHVDVTFTDGSSGRYDLVIGADGIYSRTRSMVFADAPKPRFTGQSVWRYNFPRVPEVDCIVHFEVAGGSAGLVPLAQDLMYMFTVSEEPGNPVMPHGALAELMRDRLKHFGGIMGALREQITDNDGVVYKPLECVRIEGPWHKGRVLLLGDAAHATTPHLGQGAGMAIEDAVVIAEELAGKAELSAALQGFMDRRLERCLFIARSSEMLGEWQMHPQQDLGPAARAAMFHQMVDVTAQPI